MKCLTNRLPAFDAELDVWELPPDDHSAIVPCYDAFCMRYSGMNVRAPGQWKWQMGGDNRFAIYAAGNPVEAFLTTRLKVDFWVEQEVRDLAWTTDRGYRSIMAFLRGLCMNKTGAKWWEPADSPMIWRYDDQGLEVKYDGHMMYRALDVPALLETISCEETGEFFMLVDDPHMESNRGPWRVRFGEGTTEVEKADAVDFEIGIGAFSQALLGEPSLTAVARQGAVKVTGESGFRSACRLLSPFPTFCLDFF